MKPKPKLKRYLVTIAHKAAVYYNVEANNKDEAETKAVSLHEDGVEPDDYWESSDHVEEVELVK